MKVIHNAISKSLLYHCKDPEKPRVLLIGHTGISAVNIGDTTIHSGVGIKPGIKLLVLNDKSKAALRNKLLEVEFLIINELSIVLSDLWTDIDSRLGKILMMVPGKAFDGFSVMTIADLLRLLQSEENLYFLNILIRIVLNVY